MRIPKVPGIPVERRPLLYPAGVSVGFILLLVDATGVSPYSALRLTVGTAIVTILVAWILTLVLRSRDIAALLTLVLVLAVIVTGTPTILAILAVAAVLLVAAAVISRRRPLAIRWAPISRALTILTAIMLLAVGIRALQDGRVEQAARDLVEEGPARSVASATASAGAQHPDVYLILLDGYPRADKLASEFGIDDSGFLSSLAGQGFSIASHSRSNYLETEKTLMSMLNGQHVADLTTRFDPATVHRLINDADALDPFEDAGYRTIAFSSGFEIAALRRVDEFIDTGQMNEFEKVVMQSTILPIVWALNPGFTASQQGDRTVATFERADELAGEGGPPRFTFVHVASPHSPLLFTADGTVLPETGQYNIYDDREQTRQFGLEEYSKRLGDQIAYLNRRTLELVGAIEASGRPSVIVVFSDHGSGARFTITEQLDGHSDLDLRSANLLAIRGIGPIDDRSTLINLIPEIANRILGTPFEPVPETTWAFPSDAAPVEFRRPD